MRDWLSHRATATPDRPALVRARDGETWRYGEFDREVDVLAGRLASLGLRPGDHLGVVLPPRVAYVRLVHAAMRLGLVLVPLGHDLTGRELGGRVERADLTALACGADTLDRSVIALAGTDVPLVSVDRIDEMDREDSTLEEFENAREEWEGSHRALPDVDPVDVVPALWERADPLLLLFTSGTTGTPKPVDVRMGNVLASASASAFRLGTHPDDRWLVALSLHHTGGIAPLYRATLYGTTVVLREGFEPGPTADDVDRYDVTGISLVPTMLERMLDARGTLSDSLRVVLLGGAPASNQLIQRCQGFSIPVYPTYGMTETASQVATARPEEAFDRRGTVGRPLMWTDVEIVDDEGDPVDPGERGEIVVSGPTVVPGYYGTPEETESSFGDRGFHTGDVGYLDADGYVYVTGRLDDRIVTGGENVDPDEVTGVLREHPGIADAAVVGVSDDTWGELVGALLVPGEDWTEDAPERSDDGEPGAGGRPSREELTSFCADHLADFKHPRVIAYADSIPRTVSDTVDRDAVRSRLVSKLEDAEGKTGGDETREEGGDETREEEDGDETREEEDGDETREEEDEVKEDGETTGRDERETGGSKASRTVPEDEIFEYAEPPDVDFRGPESAGNN